MKVKIILWVCAVLALASCEKPHDHTGDTPRYSVHSFYVENQLDKTVQLKFDRALYSAGDLSSEYEINKHFEVYAYPNTTTLVRVFDKGYADKEAFNCFYYDYILYTVRKSRNDFCRILDPFTGQVSTDIGNGEYWKYEQISKWEAKYTLIVDEELIGKLFPSL